VPDWLPVSVGVVVLLAAVAHGRWLLIQLHHHDAPRWRLAPTERGRLVPNTVMACWFAGGFASYSSPGDWPLVVVAAFFVGSVLVPPLLQRLGSRRAMDVKA